jgi:hypothetical protein
MDLVTILFAVLALALVTAMAAGQFRVAYRAINDGKAGFGRFTYKRTEKPLSFWIAVFVEWLGFSLAFVYLLALVAGLLFS